MDFIQFNPKDCEYDPEQCGIYIIYTLSGVYIGASTRIAGRWDTHQQTLRKGIHSCKKLRRAKVRHGLKGLRHDVLEYCPLELLDEKEDYWDRFFKARGIKVFSKPTRHGFRVTKEKQERMVSMSNAGKSLAEIASQLKICQREVSKWLKRLGVTSEQIMQRGRQVTVQKASLARKTFLASEPGAEFRRKHSLAMKSFHASEAGTEWRKKQSLAIIKFWASEAGAEVRKKRSKKI